MRIFLDCEFTDLVPGNKLISIALVDEDENYFYAELTDTYNLKDCSDFVKSEVLPYLRGDKYRMSEYECKLAITKWIEDRNVPCVVCTDAPSWDIPHLNNLINDVFPENLEKDCIAIRVPFEIESMLLIKHDYDIHNALDDAFVMKKATLGY